MNKAGINVTTMETGAEFQPSRNNKMPLGQNPEEFINIDDFALKVIDRIRMHQPKELGDLARAALEARTLVRENLKELVDAAESFEARSKLALEDIRQSRFAYVTEAAQMLKPLREVREFFIEKDYEGQITRLKEFAEICERLERLKKNGTLDAIADTIIKLTL